MTLLWRSSRRWLRAHAWQLGLSIVGVALGVAVVVAVDLASDSAQRAFEISSVTVTGEATHQLFGGPAGLPEETFAALRAELGMRRVAPVVEGWVSVPAAGGGAVQLPLRVLGVDPFSESAFRPGLGGGPGQLDLAAFLTRPGAGLLSAATATRLGVAVGDSFTARAGARPRELTLAGLLPAQPGGRGGDGDLFVTDVATAQEILGMVGKLSRIDLVIADDGAGAALLERVRAVAPQGAPVVGASAQRQATAQMTRAFRVNLAALGLLALVCGVFLVYNTMSFSVVQRRRQIGTLRSLGVTRREIFTLVLGEALAVGVAGTLMGTMGGVAIGNVLVGLVARTVNDLYFVVAVRDLAVAPLSLLKGVALGIGGAALAALAPAIEATGAAPRAALIRSQLEARARRNAAPAAAAGLLVAAGGMGLLALSGRSLIASFAALFLVILGLALLAPGFVVISMRAAAAPMGRLLGPLGRLAARGVVAALSRTAVAVAALMIAVAVIVGVGVMIDSFRGTVARWLDAVLLADLYVSAPSTGVAGGDLELPPATLAAIGRIPGVERISSVRGVDLPEAGGGRTRLIAFDIDARSHAGFDFRAGAADDLWAAFDGSDAVLVTEPWAYRHGADVGDSITLASDGGPARFRIVGVYYNYASEEGLVVMHRRTYLRHWNDPLLSSFSVYAAEDADLDAIGERIRDTLAGYEVSIRSNRALRRASLEVFDRTFLITGVLRTLVTLVAAVGVLGALMSLQLERAKEIGVLRALGLTRGEVWWLTTSQSGLMGLASGALALPVGLALAAIMIFVINRRSFGWTLQMEVSPAILLQALLIAVAAALVAGLYPAQRMAATPPAAALREE